MKSMRILVLLTTFLLTLGENHLIAQTEIDSTTLISKGDMVPQFTFKNEKGELQNISEYEGKTVMVVFFATWCGPCREELKELNNIVLPPYKGHANFEIMIFGREHNQQEVNKFKNDNNYFMPFYEDPERKIYSKFATSYIPRCFIINANGKVIFNSVGFNEEIKEGIQATLQEELN